MYYKITKENLNKKTTTTKIDNNNNITLKEINALVKIAFWGIGFDSPSLFNPKVDQSFTKNWENWKDDFKQLILEYTEKNYNHIIANKLSETAQVDNKFDKIIKNKIGDQELIWSKKLGKKCYNSIKGAKAINSITKFNSLIDLGICKGHFLSSLVLKCTIFSFPLIYIQFFYFYFEWKSGKFYYRDLSKNKKNELSDSEPYDPSLSHFFSSNLDIIDSLCKYHNIHNRKDAFKLCA